VSAPAKPLQVTFRVRLARDYHVGAGHGGGTSLDAALFTESPAGAEEPAIRAGHGILRQALFDLLGTGPLAPLRTCRASTGDRVGPEHCFPASGSECPVCRIFGSPARPSPWAFSTLRPAAPGVSGGGRRARTVSRTSVDLAARRARDATLFSEELGAPVELVFTAERAPLGSDDDALDELALLWAAARTVVAVGAGRRRGRGECSLALDPADGVPAADALLESLHSAWLVEGGRARTAQLPARTAVARSSGAPPAPWVARGVGAWTWCELRLAVRLNEPVVAGNRPLVGNVQESEPFVPGALLLGAAASAAAEAGVPEGDFLRAFVSGAILFPDLVPAAEHGGFYRPTLPAPRDLHLCSREPSLLHDGGHGVRSVLARPALEEADAGPDCPVCRRERLPAAKPVRLDHYVFDGRGGFRAAEAAFRLPRTSREETKIQVDPAQGRVRAGSLFHRQTIPAGTLLWGTLRALPEALEALAGTGLFQGDEGTATLRLGKRHRRGYGGVTLHWARVGDAETELAREATRARVRALAGQGAPLPLVAVSRVMLRDALGGCRQSLDAAALGLGALAGRCSVAVVPVGGFRRHVGLPRRAGWALAGGSVLRLDVAPAEGAVVERIVELVHGGGVGERTGEGFGRFAAAPFPYAWTDEPWAARLPDGGLPEQFAVPGPLRLRATAKDDPMGRRAGAGLRRGFELGVREAGLSGDEWRTVAHLLRARAGEPLAELATALEAGGGGPAAALRDAHAAREDRSFLGGRGRAGWMALRPLLESAAGAELGAGERAYRTRILADAIADAAGRSSPAELPR
jgi:CRISPR-associated protein Csx10